MTLTELAVASALLSVVVVAAYLLMEATTGWVDFSEAQARATEETRLAMDRMTQEIRQASPLPGQEGLGAFSQVSTSQVTFYVDEDHDALLERVSYRRAGAQLLRTVEQPVLVGGEYSFAAPGPAEILVRGLGAEWSGAIFTVMLRGYEGGPVPPSQIASSSAVVLHVRNSVTVGRRTAVSDDTTWVKVRSVENTVY